MSNFINGRIVVNDRAIDSSIGFSMVEFALYNHFAVHFEDNKLNTRDIFFKISDSFLFKYCDYYMEPIIYTLDGKPLTANINMDLDKLQGLIYTIFKYEFVERVELRFSDVEVDEWEYEVIKTNTVFMRNVILEKYLSEFSFPVINVIINR